MSQTSITCLLIECPEKAQHYLCGSPSKKKKGITLIMREHQKNSVEVHSMK